MVARSSLATSILDRSPPPDAPARKPVCQVAAAAAETLKWSLVFDDPESSPDRGPDAPRRPEPTPPTGPRRHPLPRRRRTDAPDAAGIDAPVGDFAKVDLNRKDRCGSPEVIFGLGKTAEQVAAILRTLRDHGQAGLATRISRRDRREFLQAVFPDGEHHPVARTFRVPGPGLPGPKLGRVVIVTAGTSDLPWPRRRGSRPRRGTARSPC